MELLRASYPTPAGFPFDLPRALFALFGVETKWTAGALGDFRGRIPTSFGIAQVNDPSEPYAPPQGVDPLVYDLSFPPFAAKLRDALEAIEAATATLVRRSQAGEPISVDGLSVPDWLNLAWQFGPGALRAWTLHRDRADYTGAGFATEISPTSTVTPADYLARLDEFNRYYLTAQALNL